MSDDNQGTDQQPPDPTTLGLYRLLKGEFVTTNPHTERWREMLKKLPGDGRK